MGRRGEPAAAGLTFLRCTLVACSSTGILVATKDRRFVARAMLTCLLVLGAFLHWQQRHEATAQLGTVWWGLVVFFGLRAAQSLPRVWARLRTTSDMA